MQSKQPIIRRFREGLQSRTAFFQEHWHRFSGHLPRLAKFVQWATFSFLVFLAVLLLFIFAISLTIPSAKKLEGMQADIASTVYSADSIPVQIGLYFKEFRIVATYEEIAPMTFNALVATEDERFFQHKGIDYRALGRVLVRSILRGDRSGGGGSTISQQLAKNMLPRRSFPVASLPINKIREIIIARRLERVYDKKQILALYLNTVPFPENVYGINIAAQRFFSKKPFELSIVESATLVGTLRATTFYNPLKYPERARQRRNVVLEQMYKNGMLSQAKLEALQQLPLELRYNPAAANEDRAPYFREFLRRELERLLDGIRKPDGEPYDLYKDGLKIYTSLHTGMQAIAEESVAQHLSEIQKKFDQHWRGSSPFWHNKKTVELFKRNSMRYKLLKAAGKGEGEIDRIFEQKIKMKIFTWDGEKEVEMSPLDSVRHHLGLLQAGFMAMDPYTGFIRAWVGGINYDYFQFDHILANRQPGSVFKPVVYAQALREGIPPCDQIPNFPVTYHEYAKGDWAIRDRSREDPDPHIVIEAGIKRDLDDWAPQNADGIYGGSYSLEGALTNSVNTVTVSLIMQMGVKKVVELAKSLGIETKIPVEPSIALGTAELPLYEMIQPFAAFASEGRRVRPVAVLRIENHAGEVIFSANPRTEQVISAEEANTMTRMLQSVASAGTASRLRWMYNVTDVPVAGKTGTSQNHADGWFIGYTPKIIAGAWVGGDSPLVRFRNFENGQGAATALPVVAIFMRKVLDNPALYNWHGGSFPLLSPEQTKKLACPLRIPSPEELLADSLARDSLMRLEGLQLDLENIEQ